MIDPKPFQGKTAELAQLLQDRLGIRGKGFSAKLRRAGRDLPRFARRAGAEVAQAEVMMTHPRLAALVDADRFNRAATVLGDHLKGIDPKERRKTMLLHRIASIVLNLTLLGLAVYAVLWAVGRI
ncbi:hypothetical protein [Roseovarius sp. MMSF_3281]|uniref:hypothetical protein n=1 Tax=Roseovarius sp. MMSF_3281 TaxID=3046694 RepID=UPI00273FCD93|nr:hypothetical protein [Roseovarius sp. MMSF_3281]